MKVGDNVAWKWSGGLGEGVINEICPHRTEIKNRGKVIVRNGSHENPALIIAHKSGNLVIKLQSEVQKTDSMSDIKYADDYRHINFREHPEKYKIGRGEQGVLIAEPYKSEILPYWKFKTVALASTSAEKIYTMFCEYAEQNDFVGMDMARKFLQMGFTRARRYANHTDGTKYTKDKATRPQAADWDTSEKAQAAKAFYDYYVTARDNEKYKALKKEHSNRNKG